MLRGPDQQCRAADEIAPSSSRLRPRPRWRAARQSLGRLCQTRGSDRRGRCSPAGFSIGSLAAIPQSDDAGQGRVHHQPVPSAIAFNAAPAGEPRHDHHPSSAGRTAGSSCSVAVDRAGPAGASPAPDGTPNDDEAQRLAELERQRQEEERRKWERLTRAAGDRRQCCAGTCRKLGRRRTAPAAAEDDPNRRFLASVSAAGVECRERRRTSGSMP